MASKKQKIKPFPKQVFAVMGLYSSGPQIVSLSHASNGTRLAEYKLVKVGRAKVKTTVV